MALGKPIPPKMRAEMEADPFYRTCCRKKLLQDHDCERDPLNPYKAVDWEHAIIFKGSKLNEKWAIIPICWLVHRGGKLNKEINVWIALNRATDDELRAISKAEDYIAKRERLNAIYGIPKL